MGDNVVWSVADLEDFKFFAIPFAEQAIRDGRNLIYMRFADHEPLLTPRPGLKIREFDPDKGFEAFTVDIHDRIAEEGKDAFYVFDSLSSLQSVWYTDLMMGNFFRVTCPYLFDLDTVAYFPLLRGRHSYDAVARIRDTTQLLLDVYSGEKYIYLHPLKVWNRYSPKMFLPHCYRKAENTFSTVEDGVGMSRFYQTLQKSSSQAQDQTFDSYDRFFQAARHEYAGGHFSSETEDQIIASMMTRDERLKTLVKKYFRPEDYFLLRDRMIGSGAIGGKACGMLLARKIIETDVPEYAQYNEPHDSFYIGSDVFYTYIVSNGCWQLRIRQRTEDGYFSAAPELQKHLLEGTFPASIRERFINIVEYFGQSPFIVRSSSFLEDGFGNAFAGKYESVFCVNQGSLEERLEQFEQAVRRVYASTMDYSALEYRLMRHLEKRDEQMAVLVQRVSGSYYGQYFMPGAAGVGYSHSTYKWYADMDPDAGMLRIVMGLGTKAVDRTGEDYPRLANLDRPAATVLTTDEQRHKFSQRYIDVLDCEANRLCEVPLARLLPLLPAWYQSMVLEHDYDAENRLRQTGRYRDVLYVSCQKLLEQKSFTSLMQKMMKTLERVYENPVDIEYTVNMDADGDFVINLLQCRPLYTGGSQKQLHIEQLQLESVFFEIRDSSMGPSGCCPVDVVIQIDPVKYYEYPYAKKHDVARAVGAVNQFYKGKQKNILFLTPGRIGTSSPELGVPVTFGDISGFRIICEVSDRQAGYRPELSYGSHMFQDLVETEILYGAIWNNEKTAAYHPDYLDDTPDLFPEICPEFPQLAGMIRVKEPENLRYWLDAVSNHAVCGIPKNT